MSPEEIFKAYGKSIGIGAIAMSGIIGIIKSWDIIKGSISRITQTTKSAQSDEHAPRTDKTSASALSA